MATMENLEQIQQTLSQVDARIPGALRIALGISYRQVAFAPAPASSAGQAAADTVRFAASLLQQPPPLPATADVVPEAGEAGGLPAEAEAEPKNAAPARRLRIRYGSCYVPRHDHDAHFGHADAGVLGVADGVGSYMKLGVDAGAFSRRLMANALAQVVAAVGEEEGDAAAGRTPVVFPYALLKKAFEKTAASGAPGASTAAIVSLAGGKDLKWAYIGDSGFAVLRGGRIVFRSKPQRHSRNTPFQLSAASKTSDGVALARAGQIAARDGDVVVVGTDGLFDNVSDTQLQHAVQIGTKLGFSAKNLADILAGVAYEVSKRTRMGKPDDITVLVAFVVQSDS
ncbi:hypothetical protein U9M48_026473 [Paspalum notatum var. saurae]|uniref:Protein phosphatase n=1 Tax=Paspalum notatum var. saurae TaxID=547442 RepID=A0AAQ3WYC5_PASNO